MCARLPGILAILTATTSQHEGDGNMICSRIVRLAGVVAAFAVLLVGTALVFEAFDRHSHSASDTLRPFLITMAPVWAVTVAGAWALLRSPASTTGAP